MAGNTNIPQESKTRHQVWNESLKNLVRFYVQDKNRLILFCLRNGFTETQIAKELGVTRQAISVIVRKNT